MFRNVLIIFGLIMFAILYPVHKTWGVPGAITVGVIVPGLFGVLAGLQRARHCSTARDCFKSDEQVGCGGVFVAALAAMVTGSFVAHHDKSAGFPTVLATFILGSLLLFAAAFAATYLKWNRSRSPKNGTAKGK